MSTLRVGSLFAGVGGFDMALEAAGMEIVWQIELDKQARSVLQRHWPTVELYEDVNDVGAAQLIRPDVICGGFPCQDYSVAGKRGGLAGDRGGLWWQMHRIIAELMPTWVIGENVPGLVSSNGGRDFLTIVASLVQLGYGVTWATLDSQYFGVAQRRRRLFIVGHFGGVPRPEILALSEGLFGHPAPSREAGAGATPLLEVGARTSGDGYRDGDGIGCEGDPMYSLQARHQHGLLAFDTTQVTSKANRSSPKPGDPCHPLAAGAHAPAIAYGLRADAMREGIAKTPSPDADGRVRLRDPGMGIYEEMAPTLDAGTAHGIGEGSTVPRRLTPRECERLQAWPDDHTRHGVTEDGEIVELKDGPRYRMCGNGVTSSVVEWIGHRIVSAHTDPQPDSSP